MTRKQKAFANMLIDHKNLNNVIGLPNTPVGRGQPKKAVTETVIKKKKK